MKKLILFLLAIAYIPSISAQESLWQSFLTPPDSIRVGCYYYWVNERVDPKGVVADLQWMKANGITLAFLATDIRNRDRWDNPLGRVVVWQEQVPEPTVVEEPAHSPQDS